MDNETFTICPVCRKPITEEEPDVVRAFEIVRTRSFRVGDEEHEGLGAFVPRGLLAACRTWLSTHELVGHLGAANARPRPARYPLASAFNFLTLTSSQPS